MNGNLEGEVPRQRSTRWAWIILPGALFIALALIIAGGAVADPVPLAIVSDTPVDPDGDLKYEFLDIGMEINVPSAGTYIVGWAVYDAEGTEVSPWQGESHEMNAGMNSISMRLAGARIVGIANDGRFMIYAMLLDSVGNTIAETYYETEYYYISDFEPHAIIATPFTYAVLDENSLPGYDALTVGFSVDVLVDGDYGILGDLYDQDGAPICSRDLGSVHLEAGNTPLQLQFPGSPIRSNGEDGPYYVTLTLVQDYWVLMDQETGETPEAYSYLDFEQLGEFLSFSVTESDFDGDGAIDLLTIEAYFDIKVEDWYAVSIAVWTMGNDLIDGGGFTDYLYSGTNSVTHLVTGLSMSTTNKDGPYRLLLQISSYWYGYAIDYDEYPLDYHQDDFEGMYFDAPLAEARDENGNGLYEGVYVDFDIVSSTATSISMLGQLIAEDGFTVISAIDGNFYTEGGRTTESVLFSGNDIFRSGMTPSKVVLHLFCLYDSGYYYQWLPMDEIELPTAAYPVDSFERVRFVSPYEEGSLDCDGDSLIEYLTLQVEYEVISEAEYLLEALLEDQYGSWVASIYKVQLLQAGTYTVDLEFSCMTIIMMGFEGPYTAELVLYRIESFNTYTMLAFDYYTFGQGFGIAQMESAAALSDAWDEGVDTDGSGYFDSIVLHMEVEVTCPGLYTATATVFDAFGNYLSYSEQLSQLGAGAQMIDLPFYVQPLLDVDGPFDVEIALRDDSNQFVIWEHVPMSDYEVLQFDHIILLPGITHHGLDLNGNGLYDYLAVEIVVDSTMNADGYAWGSLSGSSFYLTYEESFFVFPGENVITLLFPMMQVANAGEDAPFQAHLLVQLPMQSSDQTYLIEGYMASDFDHAFFSSPATDRPIDEDGDGLYEGVEITLYTDVSFEAWYFVIVEFYDQYYNYLTCSAEHFLLEAGINEIDLRILDRPTISFICNEGGLQVTYHLQLDGQFVCSSGSQMTQDYEESQFEKVAWFASAPTYIITDLDDDAFYEALIVEVVLHVEFALWYIASGSVVDMMWNFAETETMAFLLPGDHLIQLRFSGIELVQRLIDGPWDVYIGVSDVKYNMLDNAMMGVGGIQLSMFEPIACFDGGFNVGGLDLDKDGLYDELQVDLMVDVLAAGEYIVMCTLWCDGHYIPSCYNWTHLEAGLQKVTVIFCGSLMLDYGLDGDFTLEAELWDVTTSGSTTLDHLHESLGTYSMSQFEDGTMLAFSSEQSDRPIDKDKDGLYDWLEVDIVVYVHKAGKYTLRGMLYYNDWITCIDSVEKKVHLQEGRQVVKLRFSGPEIWAKGLSGPYGVELWILDRCGRSLGEDDMWTSRYSPSQFDRPVVGDSQCKPTVTIHLKEKGKLSIVVFGSEMFDVRKIDPTSVLMGYDTQWIGQAAWTFKDFDKDGFIDLVIKFRMDDVRSIVSLGMESIGFRMVYDGVLVEVQIPIVVKK